MRKNFYSLCFILLPGFLYTCKSSNSGITNQKTALAAPEVKAVFINGDSLHNIDIGKGDPVVFVHGTLGDYRAFGSQLDTFAKNHQVIVYSRRYAFPDKQTVNDSIDYTIVSHVQDLSAFLKLLNLGPVHLVGHSYGASVALHTTIEHPELVCSLILGEPPVISLLQNAPGGDTIWNNFDTKFKMRAAGAFQKGNDEQAVDIFVGGVIGDSLFFSKIPQNSRDRMMANTSELRGFALAKNPFPAVTCDDLKKIMVSVLLVGGVRSPILFTSIIAELDRCLSNKERAILPNASHGLQDQNPVEFNKTALRFIDRH